MTPRYVTVEKAQRIVTITLNRAEALNSLSKLMMGQLASAFLDVAADEAVDVVILTGAGRAFCVGLALKELGGESDSTACVSADDVNVSDAREHIKQPMIGAINGYAITDGFELALMCDILIGSTAASCADTHARVGVVLG